MHKIKSETKTRMKMSMRVRKRSMVKPAEETPRRSLWLSGLDLVHLPVEYVCTTWFYPRRGRNDNDEDDNGSNKDFFNAEILKESLSRALVPFYPLAGRLLVARNSKSNQQQQQQQEERLEIDCNGEGALFVEAETSQYAVCDFEEDGFSPNDRLSKVVLTPPCDYTSTTEGEGPSSVPLLIVQLTRFKCGGVALGFSQQHSVADGAAYSHFILSWSRLARGLGLEIPPLFDRTPYFLPSSLPQSPSHPLDLIQDMPSILPGGDGQCSKSPTVSSVFKMSKEHIRALKLATSSGEVSNSKLSTFEVVAGHVWRSACKARGLSHDQEVKARIPVDGRSALAVPKGYFGNAILMGECVAKVGDIVCNPVRYAASEISRMLTRMKKDREYLRSMIGNLEFMPDRTATLSRIPWGFPNIYINSWTRFPVYDIDFGWGRPIYGGIAEIETEGLCFIHQSPNGDGSLIVAVRLFSHHMPAFHKSLYHL